MNSLLDCAESFSSVVFFGFGEPHRELPFLIIFCGGKSLCTFFYEIVPEIVFLSSVGSHVTKGYGQCTFLPS